MISLLKNKYIFSLLGLGLITFLYFPTIDSLFFTLLNDPSPYAHGELILILSLALILMSLFSHRNTLTLRFNIPGIVVLAVSTVGWLISTISFIEILQQFFLLSIFASFFVAIYGHNNAKVFYIPIALLVLGLPIWNPLVPHLQNATTSTTLFLLRLAKIPSISEGMYILIPEGTFKIAELCSGMRYQAASVITVLVYAYFYKLPFIRLAVYILLISIFAFITNQLRVFIVVISGHLTNMQHYFVTKDHVSLGWVLFAILMYGFFYIVSKFDKVPVHSTNDYNSHNIDSLNTNRTNSNFSTYILILFVISIAPLLNYYNYSTTDTKVQPKKLSIDTFSEWNLIDTELGNKMPVWSTGNTLVTGRYSRGKPEYVEMFISHYRTQSNDQEAISVSNRIYNPYEWERISGATHVYNLNSGLQLKVNETIVSENLRLKGEKFDTARKRVIWSWYQIGDHTEPSAYLAKFWNLLEILKGNPSITVYIISTDLTANEGEARIALQEFSWDMLKAQIDFEDLKL